MKQQEYQINMELIRRDKHWLSPNIQRADHVCEAGDSKADGEYYPSYAPQWGLSAEEKDNFGDSFIIMFIA